MVGSGAEDEDEVGVESEANEDEGDMNGLLLLTWLTCQRSCKIGPWTRKSKRYPRFLIAVSPETNSSS